MYYKALYVTFGFAGAVAQQCQEELLLAYLLYISSHLPAQLPVSLRMYKGAIFICHECVCSVHINIQIYIHTCKSMTHRMLWVGTLKIM